MSEAGTRRRKEFTVGQTISGIFYAMLSLLVLLIITVFVLKLVRRYGGPVAGVADKVEELSGLTA